MSGSKKYIRINDYESALTKLSEGFADPAMREVAVAVKRSLLALDGSDAYTQEYALAVKRFATRLMLKWPADLSPADITRDDLRSWYRFRDHSGRSAAILLVMSAMAATGHCPEGLSWIADNLALITESASVPSEFLMKAVSSPAGFDSMVLYTAVNPGVDDDRERLYLLALDTDDPGIVNLVASCLSSRSETKGKTVLGAGGKYYFEHFAELLGELEPDGPDGLGAATFTAQQAAIDACGIAESAKADAITAAVILHLHAFRKRDADRANTPADGLCLPFLERHHFPCEWREGYRAVNYDIDDPVPEFDRWILFPNGIESASIDAKPGRGEPLDFSDLDGDAAALCKSWVWHSDGAISTKSQRLNYAKVYFANARELSLHPANDRGGLMVVTYADIARALCANKVSDGGRHMKAALKSLFKHAESRGMAVVQESGRALLETPSVGDDPSDADPVAESDLRAMLVDIDAMAAGSPQSRVVYHAVRVECCTPMRMSEILDLKISEVKPMAVPGQWRVDRIAKGHRGATRYIQLSRKAKQCIDRAIEATEELRESAPDVLKDYIFIYEGTRRSVKVLSVRQVNKVLGDVGARHGIACSTKNVRLLYMNHVIEEGQAIGFDRLGLRAVTNHTTTEVEDRHYLRPDIRNYLEAMHGVTIGTEPIKGELAEDASGFADSDLVNDGCGWCRNEECNIEGTADCLLCSGFVTTPENLPELHEAVAVLDRRISGCDEHHDKERLVSVKRLYLHYIGLLLSIEEETS